MLTTAHPNAAILRGMAAGRQVVTRFAPHDDDYTPLGSASTSALQELIRPGALVNPGRWEFAFADELEPA